MRYQMVEFIQRCVDSVKFYPASTEFEFEFIN